jgi:hypothetical protein
MSKELKLYVPVVTRALMGKNATYKTTLINANGCSTFRGQLPSIGDITTHMQLQKRLSDKFRTPFNSLKVYVSPILYVDMCKEIGRKMGAHYQTSVIDLIMSLGQIPIIQIIPKENESRQDKGVEVEKTSVADEQSSAVSKNIKEVDAKV